MTVSALPAGFGLNSGRPLQRSLPAGRDQIFAKRNRQPCRLLPDDFAERLTAQSSRFAALGIEVRESSALPNELANDLFEAVDQLELGVRDERLDAPETRLSHVGVSQRSSLWSGSFVSLAVHGALAAALATFGLSIEFPAIEGEQIVTVVMLGSAPMDEAAGDATSLAAETAQNVSHTDAPQIREVETPAEPVTNTEPMLIPKLATAAPVVATISKPVYSPKPDAPPVPAIPLLAAPMPSKTSAPEVAPQLPKDLPKLGAPKPLEVTKPQAMPKPVVQKEWLSKAKPALPPIAKAKRSVEEAKKVAKANPEAKPKTENAPGGKAKPDTKGDKTSAKPDKGKRDAKKGQVDGSERGIAAKNSAGKSASGTGNVKASNYPGLVQRKIARTRQKPSSGKGNVIVSFSITGSGALAGVSIARSSDNAAADAAAIDHIRRSSPFPAPPAGAQTRFQIPVAIR